MAEEGSSDESQPWVLEEHFVGNLTEGEWNSLPEDERAQRLVDSLRFLTKEEIEASEDKGLAQLAEEIRARPPLDE